ncbi:hypothetical protein Pla163_03480 [Planctomycetes bacterium Pla163]|uniref:Uncharacterized protein n=1 Tax=Rohdeia mirabilis TaxID=2528008 RepID=A0A518CVK9_9BACT|nr:hypothetical protein Pla163_03480 [Planctomycetes bacterium Pla163]
MIETHERSADGEWRIAGGARIGAGSCATRAAWLGALAAVAGFLCDWYREAWFGIDPGFAGGNFSHNFGVVFPCYALAFLSSAPGTVDVGWSLLRRVFQGRSMPRALWGYAVPLTVTGVILGYFALRLYWHFTEGY